MSNYIPEHKDGVSQFNSAASTQPESEVASESDVPSDINQQEEKAKPELRHLLMTRCRQGATIALDGVKYLSSTVVEQFTGPRQLHRRYWFWLGLGVGGGLAALGAGAIALERSLPDSTADVFTFVRDDTITIKAADGSILQQIGPATRETLEIEEIPERLVQAFLASEDQRFKIHDGVDGAGVVRAALSNLRSGQVVEGGSTITQQLARIVYFDQERSLGRKLKEMRMAQKIDRELHKEQILEKYLNLVYLGSGAYGVADAAWVYFGKPVKELTLSEMAMLAGLPPAPSEYSPFVDAKAAKSRRDRVLKRMEQTGYITKAEVEKATSAPLTTNRHNPKRLDRQAYYFTEYIQQELPKYVPKDVLAKKGLIVETTLNKKWQAAAEEAVKDTVANNGRWQNFEQAALVAIDPRNGQIKAMVGGKDFYDQQFNRVTQAQRQPGSTFKTFVYTTAIAAGISPHRGYLDAPYVVDGYEPKNYSDTFRGWLSIRDALTASINVIAVRALIDVGWKPTIDIAHKMGIESTLHPTYSLALGASEVNLLELTGAYGTLAAKGVHTKSHGISRILDGRGKVIYDENFKGKRVLDEDTSAIMTWMLRGVVNNGTGGAAQIDRPVAGKTGTSDKARDLWFIGYIPQVVAGVWLGNDDNQPTSGASSTAAATWRRFMSEAVEDLKIEEFPERPEKVEGRKGIIKTEPIKPKRAYTKPIPQPEPTGEGNPGGNSGGNTYGQGSAPPVRVRRRRRRSYNNTNQTIQYVQPEQPVVRRRSRREYAARTAPSGYRRRSSYNGSGYSNSSRRRSTYNGSGNGNSSRRRSSYSSSGNSNSSRRSSSRRYSAPRQSAPVQQTYQSAPPPPQPVAAPAPRVEPVAAPLAPPAARKEVP